MVKNSRFAGYSVRISDEAFVVRGGQNRIEDIRRGIGTHPSGITGVSVESAEGVTIVELSRALNFLALSHIGKLV